MHCFQGEFLAKQTHEAQPHGMQIHSLAHLKGAGGGQQTFTQGIPSQLAMRGNEAEPRRSSHPCNLGCTAPVSGPGAAEAQSS